MLLKTARQLSGVRSRWSRTTAVAPTLQAPPEPGQPGNNNAKTSRGGSQRQYASAHPEATVYTGPQSPRKAVTLRTLRAKYEKGQPISMVTAYDYPSAVHVDLADIDIVLVGDSVSMVVHGHDTTLPITLDDMVTHCKAVARGATRAFLVGDLPFGSYELSTTEAVRSAIRMLKEGGMDAVKLEGGSPARVEAARAIVEAGVAVIGHVGLTPQSVSVLGGFRPQAQVASEAVRVINQAKALQDSGCFAIVLECIPAPIAAAVTQALDIPTIGIGAGPECSGQVLVYHDLLGMMSHPHHAKVTPKFCKRYAEVGRVIQSALVQYRQDVEDRTFPGQQYSPYNIPDGEVELLVQELRGSGMQGAADAVQQTAALVAAGKALGQQLRQQQPAAGGGGPNGSAADTAAVSGPPPTAVGAGAAAARNGDAGGSTARVA